MQITYTQENDHNKNNQMLSIFHPYFNVSSTNTLVHILLYMYVYI